MHYTDLIHERDKLQLNLEKQWSNPEAEVPKELYDRIKEVKKLIKEFKNLILKK